VAIPRSTFAAVAPRLVAAFAGKSPAQAPNETCGSPIERAVHWRGGGQSRRRA
jgi:hypothetical protein